MRTTMISLLVIGVGMPALVGPALARPSIAENYRGLWEGTLHGGRGDQAMAFVFRPRGPAGFEGMVYLDGRELGAMQSGRLTGDTLSFSVMGFDVAAVPAGERLSVDLVVRHGKTHHLEMARASADTTRRPAVPEAPAPAAPVARDLPPDSIYRAREAPPSAVSSVASCLKHGTLLLVGGGPSQPDLDQRFLELAGGPTARVVVIPTAAMERVDSSEVARVAATAAHNLGGARVTVLHTLSRREADSEAFVAPLRQATGVWILGGDGAWLLDSYLGTRTERELIAVMERGGVVGGTSAGAVIWGSSLLIFRQAPGSRAVQSMRSENLVIGDPHGSGIGVLGNVAIAPHFAEFHLEPPLDKLVAARPGLLGIGIDEATALEVHGEVGRVLGRGRVTIVPGSAAQAPVVLRDGARYDLIRRTML